MKSLRSLIRSIISCFVMSSPDHLTRRSAHDIWFRDMSDSEKVHQYLVNLMGQYCAGDFAAVGPDDWYVSEAGLYKATDGVEHECLIATLRLTPRTSKPSTQSPGYETSVNAQTSGDPNPVYYLTLERGIDRKQDAQGPSFEYDNVRWQMEDSRDSDPVASSLRISESGTKLLLGRHFAGDTASLSMSPKNSNYKLLLNIKFPSPSTTLPHEEDLDTIFKTLSAQNQLHTPSEHPSFVSLPTLISLADYISQVNEIYTTTSSNCYCYSSMIFFCLRRYTASEIIFFKDQKINPNDSVDVMKDQFKHLNRGHFGMLKLVEIPSDEIVTEVLDKWGPQREKMNKEVHTHRLTRIESEMKRREGMEKYVKMEGAVERLRGRLRGLGWAEEDIKNLFEC